jgi:hypothetical protein
MKQDYAKLNDPFPESDKDEDSMLVIVLMINNESYNTAVNDGPISLREAKLSPDWPEWEKAIKIELEQLRTWVPGNLLKSQSMRFPLPKNGFSSERLIISARSIKEDVYMKQPEGYSDGTDKVCHLIKTLYGLKQSRRKWNLQFDQGVQAMGFTCLVSDPCTYVRWQGKEFQIITVWVDDLLIFTTSEVGMHLTKSQITQRWEVTDLGKPSKIIGIEIIRRHDSISIT